MVKEGIQKSLPQVIRIQDELANRKHLTVELWVISRVNNVFKDIGVISGAIPYIRESLKISATQEIILVGSLNVCSLIGSLAAGKTSDTIGRRYTIILAAITFFVGAILMGLAPSYPFLMAGRVIAGIGVGYSLTISPLYTTEISPALTRGFLGSLPELFITIGTLLGYISNYTLSGLSHDINWRIMLGLTAVPAFGVGLGVIAMPESPCWLVMKGRFSEAKKVLVKTSESYEEAELRLCEISKAANDAKAAFYNQRQQQQHGGSTSSNTSGSSWHSQGVWKELLWKPSSSTRRILISALGLNFFMQASGNDAVVYYLPEVFKDAGIHNKRVLFGINCIMGTSKAFFVFISALFLDKYGRRPLMLLGSSGMTISLSVLAIGSTFLEHSKSAGGHDHKPLWAIVLSVVAVCADVSFFSIGLGPITWVYSSEIFPLRLRAQGTSLAISVNRLVSGLVSMTFLSLAKEITFGGMFFLLSGIMAVGTVFFFFFMPETKGRSLEEIGSLFEDQKKTSNTTSPHHDITQTS